MWNLGNRDVIVLVSVISGCALSCKIFGPFVALAITFILIICVTLTHIIVDETPFAPHALLAVDYLDKIAREINARVEIFVRHLSHYPTIVAEHFALYYRHYVVERMSQRRRSTYQLSAETQTAARNSSRFSLVDGLSPIARTNYRQLNSSNVENTPFGESDTRILRRAGSLGQLTSTPLVSWRKENARNGDIFSNDPSTDNRNPWKNSQSFLQNHNLQRGEEVSYSGEASPWGTSISPKMRARPGGVKTVQTVAGPLLASTRYNIDPKTYADVTSPGLTTRLTKYATEANLKLTHQSQYGTGQFPRVNLNASPTPLINAKMSKGRSGVTVRVAPPENTRYSPPERQQIMSEICQTEGKSGPSVVQVLREISLKRHASREDVTFELAKKQRTEAVYGDGLENLEEMTQKRVRDDSWTSEDEVASSSPSSKQEQVRSVRPAKRTKMPSCHDIISSLSSSIGVSSGVKRKAVDVSRSGTPEVGKHFKSLENHGDGVVLAPLSRTVSEPVKPTKRMLNEPIPDTQRVRKKSTEVKSPQRGILKTTASDKTLDTRENAVSDDGTRQKNVGNSNGDKLTDKLFMKAEPQNIDKLKTLIEEHGSIEPRFNVDDPEEIKKSDIVAMRQTSMRTRLKSMFDAISGKATSDINPKVVIQAEEPKISASPLLVASLSSTTSTTNVNTSPIATSAIVPIIGKVKPTTTPAKHVTFAFGNDAPKGNIVEGPKTTLAETKIVEKSETTKSPISATSTATISAPIFSVTPSSPSVTSPKETSTSGTATTSVSASSGQLSQIFASTTSSAPIFGSSPVAKSVSSPIAAFGAVTPSAEKSSPKPAINFSFGPTATSSFGAASTRDTVTSSQSTVTTTSTPMPTTTSSTSSTTAISGPFSFGVAKSSSSDTAMSFGTGTSSSSLFGGNPGVQTAEKKGFSFGSTTTPPTTSEGKVSATAASLGITTANTVAVTTSCFASSFNVPSTSVNLFGSSTTNPSTTSSVFSSATSSTTAPVFNFGANSTTATATTATTKTGFSFVTSPATTSTTTTSSSTQPSLPFGGGNSAVPVFGATTTTTSSSMFGAPAATSSSFPVGAPIFTSISVAPATSPTFGIPKTSGNSAFGTVAVTASSFSAVSAPSSLFSAPNNNNTSATPAIALPSFGSSNFGQTKAPPPAFGSTETTANSSSSLFGNSQPITTSAFGTSATPIFGTNSTPSVNFGTANTAPPAFGTTNTATTSFGSVTTPTTTAFGASATATFGTTGTAANSNSTNSSFGTGTAFGAVTTAPPAFPTAITSSGSFGNTNFPNSASANPPPAFSIANSSFTGFTADPLRIAPQPTCTTSFITPNTANMSFGASNNTGVNTGAFTFGATQTNTQQTQQNTGFSYGPTTSGNNANSAPFQFGTTAPQTGGFNFSGAPSTPSINFSKDATSGSTFSLAAPAAPSFNAPATGGGMFSIGTGSTAPRSRPSRRRQR